MELSPADLAEFIAVFLGHVADNMDEVGIEYVTPAELREHASLIRLRELEKDMEAFFNR